MMTVKQKQEVVDMLLELHMEMCAKEDCKYEEAQAVSITANILNKIVLEQKDLKEDLPKIITHYKL